MKLDEALESKKKELEELQKDIDALEGQAEGLKDTVKKYNELKSKSSELKKQKNHKQKEFNTVIGFFQNVDENYLTNIFPLFANIPASNEVKPLETKTGSAA